MQDTIRADKLIEEMLIAILLKDTQARVAVIGPSTLDQDHTTLFLSDLLAGTEGELLVVDIPEERLRGTYGSLRTLKSQMAQMRQVYPHLKEPTYLEENLFTLKGIPSGSIDFLLDHSALGWIALNIPEPVPPYEEAASQVIAKYKALIKPDGTIMLAGRKSHFDGSKDSAWQIDVAHLLAANQLNAKIVSIKDIDLRNRFPEICDLRDKKGFASGYRGQYYPCDTVALCTKG
ncbi:hypothetical protein HYX08_06845 [Candidatus Woesearchaeota archaeon]|nr:hypothetical protein [Candidatus Woesearchaeota archaeon]